MHIFYSEDHKLRDSKFEIHDGQIVEPFERSTRMDYILAELDRRGFNTIEEPRDFGLTIAKRLHREDYLDFLSQAYALWQEEGKSGEAMTYIWPAASMRQDVIPEQIEAKLGYYCLSADTTITEGTWQAALASKNCAEAAAQALLDGRLGTFALSRPPGHHASSFQFGGYCFLNNAAIAAERLLHDGAKRVSIIDVDFHHGNGTQEIFYERADVQFLSIHGDPNFCFPYFLGYKDETGAGKGEGFTRNYPLAVGSDYAAWQEALEAACAAIKAYKPDALIVSLGVDGYEHDPISSFKLKSDDFTDIGHKLGTLSLPTAFVMEGGYAIEAIGVNTVNMLDGFLN